MPRKKKTAIHGTDTAYTSDFSQPLPTNKIEQTPAPKPDPTPITPQKAVQKTATQKAEQPAKTTEKPKLVAKPVRMPTADKQVRKAKPDLSDKREIALAAAVKIEQHDKLVALEAKGISAKDAITIAGRRAVEQFVPKPDFVEKSDDERMPMRQGYKSTKRVPAAMLDALRDKHDPLRLSSDSAMMRGQFEPLFWSCLDAVIEELNNRF